MIPLPRFVRLGHEKDSGIPPWFFPVPFTVASCTSGSSSADRPDVDEVLPLNHAYDPPVP